MPAPASTRAATTPPRCAPSSATRASISILDPVGGKSWTEGYDLLGAVRPPRRVRALGGGVGQARATSFTPLAQVLQVKKWSPMKLMDDNKTIGGTNMGHLFARPDLLAPQLTALLEMYERREIAPHVDRTFPFAEAAAAHHYIHDRKAKGKVLLVP